MISSYKKDEVLFVSSYPPRQCGIATYTQDLMNAINEKFGDSLSLKVCALENNKIKRLYGHEVKYVFDTSDHLRYTEIAKEINNDKNIKLIFLQHEFGLFSGHNGENLLSFLYTLHKPVIASFHTVLSNPDNERRCLVRAMESVIDQIVVMTESSADILRKEYAVPQEKISIIYHGTHLVEPTGKSIKKKYNLENNYVLSTFGLLSSGKCIETALDALPSIIDRFPNVMYLIIGKTHPEIIKHEKEKYREFLETKIKNLGIEKHVKFINRYLSLDELLEYLQLTDIYFFTSKDPFQTVSGTFSYAMGCSCPIISTPIPHAKEMLSDNCGIIVDFHNSKQLSDAAIGLLSDPLKRKQMSLNALHKIRPTSWQNSALAHAALFEKIMIKKQPLIHSVPGISFDHIKRLTTKAGIIQFSEVCQPDLNSGYTLDDNARALVAIVWAYEINPASVDVKLIDIYLNFIKYSQQQDGGFLNYVDQYGGYHEKNHYVNLEDSMGRGIWSLGEFISRGHLVHGYFINRAETILEKSLNKIPTFKSPRAIAFVIKGLHHYNIKKKSPEIKNLISKLADDLILKYHATVDLGWKWFEEYLTYANSVLPEALLYAYLSTGKKKYKEVAKSSFDFLISLIFIDNKIKVISNRGWHKKGEVVKQFGEQPIDVAYTILSLDLFYEVFGNVEYRKKMDIAFSWFHGNNHLQQIIYNPVTGGCQDGLEENNVNLNQGAESTICYLLARLVMEKYIGAKNKEVIEQVMHEPEFLYYNDQAVFLPLSAKN